MAETASINFKKSTAWQIYHNDKHRPGYAIGGEVLCRPDAAEALRIKQDIVNRAIETYTKRTGQKFQAKSYEWSAVVNLKDKPTQELYKDLRTLALHFQKKYGYQCYQIAIHKDEGHIDENGEKCLNLHAHLEFITLDKETGRNKFNRRDNKYQTMRDMQTETAEILGMERGIDKRLSKVKRIEPRILADIHESTKKATKEQLDKLFEKTRKEMIAEKDNQQEQYKELRELKKEVCNDENATLKQALRQIQALKEKQRKDKAERDEKAQELEKTKAEIDKKNEKIAETRNLTRKLIEFIRENRKEQSKNENQSIIVKIQGQPLENDLKPSTIEKLAQSGLNNEITRAEKLLNEINTQKSMYDDVKKAKINALQKIFEKIENFNEPEISTKFQQRLGVNFKDFGIQKSQGRSL